MPDFLLRWWSSLQEGLDIIPEESVAILVYVIGTIIALWCWYEIAKRLPSPIGGMTWIILFAVLATPTVSEGVNAKLAPAIFGLLFGILTKEVALVRFNAALILLVIAVGMLIGFLWNKYRLNQVKHLDEL